jgi:uncharacterized protein YueI
MSKRDLIDQIRRLNPPARPEFLAEFEERALLDYLKQLSDLQREQSRHVERELALPVPA